MDREYDKPDYEAKSAKLEYFYFYRRQRGAAIRSWLPEHKTRWNEAIEAGLERLYWRFESEPSVWVEPGEEAVTGFGKPPGPVRLGLPSREPAEVRLSPGCSVQAPKFLDEASDLAHLGALEGIADIGGASEVLHHQQPPAIFSHVSKEHLWHPQVTFAGDLAVKMDFPLVVFRWKWTLLWAKELGHQREVPVVAHHHKQIAGTPN